MASAADRTEEQVAWAARFAQLKGDVAGGVVSALVAIPLAVAFGMFAFVGLGDAYFGQGMVAGLSTAIVVALVCIALGERGTAVYAPRVITTFFIGAIIVNGLVASHGDFMRSAEPRLVIAVVFAVILMAGVFQVLFGLTGVGTLLKHTPHPVMAGFQNAAALLLGLVQSGQVLGFAHHVPFYKVFSHLDEVRPLSLVVALAAGLALWHGKRIAPKVPPLLTGLVVGTAVYYLFEAVGLSRQLGPTLGAAPSFAQVAASTPPALVDLVRDARFFELAPAIVTSALSLALVASIDALLCSRLLGLPSGDRPLVRLGTGNVAAACVGGITSGFNLGPSLANRAFGARTRASVLVNVAIMLLTLVALMPLVGLLPRAVLSATVVVIAIQAFDPWTTKTLRQLAARDVIDWKRASIDLVVALVVAVIAIVADIVVAVIAGLVIAIAFFLVRMSRSIVRSSRRGETTRSRRVRDPHAMQALSRLGGRIVMIELEGAMFFGTAEQLVAHVDQELAVPTSVVILDFRRVSEVDITGARILLQLGERVSKAGAQLALSSLSGRAMIGRALLDMGVIEALGIERTFPDRDQALEWAEDQLLARPGAERPTEDEIALEALDLFAGFEPAERYAAAARLERREYRRNEVVAREGDHGSELFIIVKGSATGRVRTSTGRETRLMSFAPGTIVGELGLLDEEERSATIVADEELVCLVLARAEFEAMMRDEPGIALKLLANLSREISWRLRRANRMISDFD
ncbi:MAG: SLC26A/SulP transporter family protein [Bacillota bacterium]